MPKERNLNPGRLNGDSPYFVLTKEGLGDATDLHGPFSKTMAEHVREVFGGAIFKEVVEITFEEDD